MVEHKRQIGQRAGDLLRVPVHLLRQKTMMREDIRVQIRLRNFRAERSSALFAIARAARELAQHPIQEEAIHVVQGKNLLELRNMRFIHPRRIEAMVASHGQIRKKRECRASSALWSSHR